MARIEDLPLEILSMIIQQHLDNYAPMAPSDEHLQMIMSSLRMLAFVSKQWQDVVSRTRFDLTALFPGHYSKLQLHACGRCHLMFDPRISAAYGYVEDEYRGTSPAYYGEEYDLDDALYLLNIYEEIAKSRLANRQIAKYEGTLAYWEALMHTEHEIATAHAREHNRWNAHVIFGRRYHGDFESVDIEKSWSEEWYDLDW